MSGKKIWYKHDVVVVVEVVLDDDDVMDTF